VEHKRASSTKIIYTSSSPFKVSEATQDTSDYPNCKLALGNRTWLLINIFYSFKYKTYKKKTKKNTPNIVLFKVKFKIVFRC
jgi:hypothetical protein